MKKEIVIELRNCVADSLELIDTFLDQNKLSLAADSAEQGAKRMKKLEEAILELLDTQLLMD